MMFMMFRMRGPKFKKQSPRVTLIGTAMFVAFFIYFVVMVVR